MARKARTHMKKVATPQERPFSYSMSLSRDRLELEGFHPLASSQTSVLEMIESWKDLLRRQLEAPPIQAPTMRMTRAFLLLREEPTPASEPRVGYFENLIMSQAVGLRVLTEIFARGHRSALHLALTSKRMWLILTASVNYFDFYAGRLQNLGPSGIFVCAAPEFTLGEIMATRLSDPYGFQSATPFTNWHNAAITREMDAVDTLFMVRARLDKEKKTSEGSGSQPVPEFLRRMFDEPTLRAILAIEKPKNIFKMNQFISLPSGSAFEPPMIYSATRLQLLLIKMFNQRENTEVLHFYKIPFFDRRILAIILRACPNVTMLGVYDCPLIHLGDLIPLLDLIYEINMERKLQNKPLIGGFDFYPSFHKGFSAESEQRVFGLTADSMDRDIIQRGLFAVLLKGFLKARQLKLGLLFEPGRALRAFLFRVPNPPLSIPTFFDGLCRYLESGALDTPDTQRRRALYDLTKPIRLGLEPDLEESFYQEDMDRYLPFCSSCGYEMLYELFPAGTRRVDPHRRVCAGCNLQDLLDKQPHNMRDWKVGLLAKLMPDWNGLVFNKDAPTGDCDLMSLQATETLRNEPSPLFINRKGELAASHNVIGLLRDNKTPADSLQNLPALQDLVEGAGFDAQWTELFNHCHKADIYARARMCINTEARKKELKNKGLVSKRPRDWYGEVWRREKHAQEVQSFDYRSAVLFHLELESKGW
ncbi:hypothetical protein BBAD15_g2184 [Beauveria bassiana D1-5]|uniref:Uncharacterized protein n=1 Tax=Beauveria bassiana D1-5 TaxID=1245745 RepID=A0A0A2WFX9_BEABA|nr:hypothetical protein BBAD15_g2184 [Beauveria bassiana D1-5]